MAKLCYHDPSMGYRCVVLNVLPGGKFCVSRATIKFMRAAGSAHAIAEKLIGEVGCKVAVDDQYTLRYIDRHDTHLVQAVLDLGTKSYGINSILAVTSNLYADYMITDFGGVESILESNVTNYCKKFVFKG